MATSGGHMHQNSTSSWLVGVNLILKNEHHNLSTYKREIKTKAKPLTL